MTDWKVFKNDIIDELTALIPLGIAGAEPTLDDVRDGKYDSTIDSFEAISCSDATDLLISMHGAAFKPGDGR